MRGFWAIFRKEAVQMARDAGTLRFAFLLPVFQLVLFGLIDTNVEHVPTALYDQSRTAASRALVADFVNTGTFDLVRQVQSRAELRSEIVAGHVSVGIEIPPDFAERRLYGQPATVLVLIDGSDSTIASQSLATANGLGFATSVAELLRGQGAVQLPFEVRPTLLFNPDSRSANLLIPGLIAIVLTFSGTMLTSFAIVRERERGTLEQLMVTPVSPLAVVLGKILPYLVLSFLQLLVVLALMVSVFRVPIHGSLWLLLGLSVIYLFALLALGLLLSSRAKTQMEATQLVQMVLLPSIMLSGYIFSIPSLPTALQWISQVLPATHFIAITRGIVIRGAAFGDLWEEVVKLLVLAAVLVAGSARAFKKTVG
ncbi:MAG: ABC transporter permease [Thermoanaerobaculia bacterium]|nr:ABC transporter permease [Thermoanaerobaculia bacterium]